MWDTGAGQCFISLDAYQKYFSFKKLKPSNLTVRSAQGYNCVNKGSIELLVEIRSLKVVWTFYVIEGLTAQCIIGTDFMHTNAVKLDFAQNVLSIHKDIAVSKVVDSPPLDVNLIDSSLHVQEQAQFMEFSKNFSSLISDIPGLTQVACQEINTGTQSPVFFLNYTGIRNSKRVFLIIMIRKY